MARAISTIRATASAALARALSRLDKPLSADGRAACRRELLAVAMALGTRAPASVPEALAALRPAAVSLHRLGWTERMVMDEVLAALRGGTTDAEEEDDAQG